jgi:hypothetical protein
MKDYYKGRERDKPKPNQPDKPKINLGEDYASLKPVQQEGRKATDSK